MIKLSKIQNANLPKIESTKKEELIAMFKEKFAKLDSSDPQKYKHLVDALQNGRFNEANSIIKSQIATDHEMLALVDHVHAHDHVQETKIYT